MDLLLPVVENSALGVNCADGAGLTGLMAALEKGRLEVVDRLLDHKDIDMDFTQTDAGGRNSPGRYVSIIQSNIESGPKMIQFKIKSKIFIQ